MKEKEYFKCTCGSEILLIEQDAYSMEDEYNFAMFSHFPRDNSLKERLRICWWTLKTGTPFTDAMLLHKTDLEKLNKFLTKLLK